MVRADLAGVHVEDVALEIRGRQLLIAGERRAEGAEGRLFQQIEIEHGPFRRSVELGADVIAEEAKASYEDGILVVEVPLARRDERARRVPIEEAATRGDRDTTGDGGPQEIEVGPARPRPSRSCR